MLLIFRCHVVCSTMQNVFFCTIFTLPSTRHMAHDFVTNVVVCFEPEPERCMAHARALKNTPRQTRSHVHAYTYICVCALGNLNTITLNTLHDETLHHVRSFGTDFVARNSYGRNLWISFHCAMIVQMRILWTASAALAGFCYAIIEH